MSLAKDNRVLYKNNDGPFYIEMNQKYSEYLPQDDEYEQYTYRSVTPRQEYNCVNPKQNTNAASVWGKAKCLYKPMISADLDRFDVNQERTKKDYQDDVISNRTKSSSSFLKFIHLAKHNLQYSITQGACNVDRSLEAVDSKTRFNIVFPEMNNDQYQGAYRCRLIIPDDSHVYSGQCFICTDYVCFYVESVDNLFDQVVPLKISCPFVNVQKITKASKIMSGTSLNVIPLGPDLKPSVIQLWTADGNVHQFTAFGANFDAVFMKMTTLYRLHTLV